MKYFLLLLPLFKYLNDILSNLKGIKLNSENIELANLFKLGTFDSVINLIAITIVILFILKKMKIDKGIMNIIMSIIFIIYIIELHSLVSYIHICNYFKPLVSSPHLIDGAINLIPFKNISLIFYSNTTFIQVLGNALLLSPLAFFIHYFKLSTNYKKTFNALFITALFIEFFQLFQSYTSSMFINYTIKSFDVDDIILNSISIIIGLIAYKIYLNINLSIKKTLK